MNNYRSIITGDIVNSTRIQSQEALISILNNTIRLINDKFPLRSDIFRGDSFQIELKNISQAMLTAVLIRAGLKSQTPENEKNLWDARISIGIGELSYDSDNISTSTGEAYILSGHGLDNIGKDRLVLHTRWKEIDEEFEVSTAFADNIISSWSKKQSEVMFENLLNDSTQTDIARKLQSSNQNIGKLERAAKENLIRLYLDRFEKIISEKI